MPRSILVPLVLTLILSFLFILFLFNVVAISFTKLGLTPEQTFAIFFGTIVGGFINIPVSQRKVVIAEERRLPFPFFYYPPRVATQVIFINVGGAVVPVILSIYFLPRAPLIPTLIAILVMTALSKLLARPVPGVGIALPALVPPIASALLALLLAPASPAPVAYISGVLGTLIGADLLNLGRIKEVGSTAVSIGGAGVFDGVFLTGIIAALLT
ncbi:MAG TPA: DUF1614 domain-containing protein [Anaerolineae bacterium]|jgi:uncharacterized membrane protein|nr:DUF1614 domain-containing protein [Anaerolineae bacterium]